MARKSWSNLLLLFAAVSLALALTPNNRLRMANWVITPACLMLAAYVRRRMI